MAEGSRRNIWDILNDVESSGLAHEDSQPDVSEEGAGIHGDILPNTDSIHGDILPRTNGSHGDFAINTEVISGDDMAPYNTDDDGKMAPETSVTERKYAPMQSSIPSLDIIRNRLKLGIKTPPPVHVKVEYEEQKEEDRALAKPLRRHVGPRKNAKSDEKTREKWREVKRRQRERDRERDRLKSLDPKPAVSNDTRCKSHSISQSESSDCEVLSNAIGASCEEQKTSRSDTTGPDSHTIASGLDDGIRTTSQTLPYDHQLPNHKRLSDSSSISSPVNDPHTSPDLSPSPRQSKRARRKSAKLQDNVVQNMQVDAIIDAVIKGSIGAQECSDDLDSVTIDSQIPSKPLCDNSIISTIEPVSLILPNSTNTKSPKSTRKKSVKQHDRVVGNTSASLSLELDSLINSVICASVSSTCDGPGKDISKGVIGPAQTISGTVSKDCHRSLKRARKHPAKRTEHNDSSSHNLDSVNEILDQVASGFLSSDDDLFKSDVPDFPPLKPSPRKFNLNHNEQHNTNCSLVSNDKTPDVVADLSDPQRSSKRARRKPAKYLDDDDITANLLSILQDDIDSVDIVINAVAHEYAGTIHCNLEDCVVNLNDSSYVSPKSNTKQKPKKKKVPTATLR